MIFLIADDDIDDVELFKETLNEINASIQLYTAYDGQEALSILRSGEFSLPDIIFLDLNMPRMGGKECLKELKSDSQLRHIPVIMYTTSSQSKDIEETMMKGAVCFITKPANMKDLRNILSSIAESLPANLETSLRQLSRNSNTFIVC